MKHHRERRRLYRGGHGERGGNTRLLLCVLRVLAFRMGFSLGLLPAAPTDAALPILGGGHLDRRHGRRRSRQAGGQPHAGGLQRSRRRQSTARRHGGVGIARHARVDRAGGTAASGGLHLERTPPAAPDSVAVDDRTSARRREGDRASGGAFSTRCNRRSHPWPARTGRRRRSSPPIAGA